MEQKTNNTTTRELRSLKRLVAPQPCRTCKYFKHIPKSDGWGDCLWAKEHRHALPTCISDAHTTHAAAEDCDLWDNKPELTDAPAKTQTSTPPQA